MASFIIGFMMGIFLTLIICANAYSDLEDELMTEKENNKKLAETIEEIRKEKENGNK